uniref:Ras-GEF domain-containing protein n=1 Tax=Arcella intermedia TaxID=1963864 RepID=A0A6B2KY60_9EUKA
MVTSSSSPLDATEIASVIEKQGVVLTELFLNSFEKKGKKLKDTKGSLTKTQSKKNTTSSSPPIIERTKAPAFSSEIRSIIPTPRRPGKKPKARSGTFPESEEEVEVVVHGKKSGEPKSVDSSRRKSTSRKSRSSSLSGIPGTEYYVNNILLLIETFAPEEWSSSSAEIKAQLKGNINYQFSSFLEEITNSQPTTKSKNHRRISKRSTESLKSLETESIINNVSLTLGSSTLKIIERISKLMSLYKDLKEKKDLPSIEQIKQDLLEEIKKTVHSLEEIQTLFPWIDSIYPDISKIGDDFSVESLPLKEEEIKRGQCFNLLKTQILNYIQLRTERLFSNITSILTMLGNNSFEENQLLGLVVLSYTLSVRSCCMEMMIAVETLLYTEQISEKRIMPKYSAKKLKTNSLPLARIESPEEVSDSSSGEQDIYRPGTLGDVIVRLTSNYDETLSRAFIFGYRAVCTPSELVEKLMERYDTLTPKEMKMKRDIGQIKRGTLQVMALWIKLDFYNISNKIINQISLFVKQNLLKDNFPEFAKIIFDLLQGKGRFEVKEVKLPFSLPLYDFPDFYPQHFLLFSKAKVVAEQLTIYDLEYYRKIEPRELVGLKWDRKSQQIFSSNVVELLHRANRISHWVSSCILFNEKLSDRVKVLKKIIKIGSALYNLENYNSLMGIIAGINMAPTTRLKHTFALLPKKSTEELNNLCQYQDPTGSFKFLRNSLKSNQQTTLIPYLGIYLSDLTMLEENANATQQQLINVHKHHLLGTTISELLSYQQNTPPTLEKKEPIFSFLYDIPSLPAERLYNLSLMREPREN